MVILLSWVLALPGLWPLHHQCHHHQRHRHQCHRHQCHHYFPMKNIPTFMVIFIFFSFHQYLPGLWPLLGQNLCNHDTLESELDRFILSNAGSIVYYYYMYYHPIGNTWWECLKLVKNGKCLQIILIFSFADQMWNDVKLISKRY